MAASLDDAAQAEVEERAAEYADALVAMLIACPSELPPKGTYTDIEPILAALRSKTEGGLAPVMLLRSSYIKARAALLRAATSDEERRRLALPRRQDLERDEPWAFMSADELAALPRNDEKCGGQLALGASSYCWLTPEHPDPLGHQLMSLADAIERAEAEKCKQHNGFPSEAGFFIDYTSIHQKDAQGERQPEEAAAFQEALSTMQIWYAHTKATAFLTRDLPPGNDHLPKYAERGWTTCESSWAALAKVSAPGFCGTPIWDVTCDESYKRGPPMAPAAMARRVAGRRFTSKKGDLPMVIEINTRTILSLFRDVDALGYIDLDWGDKEVAQLCEVLPLCASLKKLNLAGNAIGDAGVAALVELMKGGALPNLERLVIRRNPIGEAGQAALAEALGGGGLGRLETLVIGDPGSPASRNRAPSAELRAACEGRGISWSVDS